MILLSAHNMLAGLTKIPELQMDKAESDMLAKGIAGVAEHYETVAMSPKTAAWVNLGQIAAMVYGPRIFAGMARKRASKPQRAAPPSQPQSPAPAAPDADLGFGPRVVNF